MLADETKEKKKRRRDQAPPAQDAALAGANNGRRPTGAMRMWMRSVYAHVVDLKAELRGSLAGDS